MEDHVIHINGSKHNINEMTNEQRYFVSQIRDLQQKSAGHRFQLDQANVAQNYFTNKLIASLNGEVYHDPAMPDSDFTAH